MAIAWDDVRQRYQELSERLTQVSLSSQDRLQIQKEHSYLNSILSCQNAIEDVDQEIAGLNAYLKDPDDLELAELYHDELQTLLQQKKEHESALDDLLFPPDQLDNRSVFLEVRAGAGGQEAALFAADLLKMYSGYALNRHWSAAVVSESETDLGGYKEVVVHIQGKGVYGALKFESGVHRVQRVPQTETQGRVHTSTATVAVLPEVNDVDVSINPQDLRIDVFRASGAGGQHVNTTDSAVRITHIPTGVVVSCQDERSQHKNKAKAMKMLQSRIVSAERERQDAEQSKNRREQVGTGMRAEKVRTYNYPQNRVTDHQVNVTLKKLDVVMQGPALQEIVDALQEHERTVRRSQPLSLLGT